MPEQRLSKRLGSLPIMLKSKACYLRNLSRHELVERKVGGVGWSGGWVGGWSERGRVGGFACSGGWGTSRLQHNWWRVFA
jgi:hypothetical protein